MQLSYLGKVSLPLRTVNTLTPRVKLSVAVDQMQLPELALGCGET